MLNIKFATVNSGLELMFVWTKYIACNLRDIAAAGCLKVVVS